MARAVGAMTCAVVAATPIACRSADAPTTDGTTLAREDSIITRTVAAGLPLPLVDHHVHILGPDVLRDWQAVGVSFSRPASTYSSVSAWLASRALDTTHLDAMVLVPMAQLYGSAEFVDALGLDVAAGRQRVARENDHVAREAERHAGRAVALCAVPALAAFARDELARCLAHPHTAGIKLHLAASGVDLRDSQHVAHVATLFADAETSRTPVLLHLDTQQRGTDVAHVRLFLERALGPARTVPVLIAHAGGSGGYGAWTRAVLRTIVAWRDSVDASEGTPRPVYIDLSAVVLDEASEGVPPTTAAERASLQADVRAAGLERFVFGSDAPVFHPLASAEAQRKALALTPDEARILLTRRLPRLFDALLPRR